MRILSTAITGVRRVLDALLLALIVVVLFGVALGKLVPLAGAETLVIGGASMAPAIPVGAAVVVTPADPSALGPGDVVSLRAGPDRALFTHRIVRIVTVGGRPQFETKGDANAAPDPTLVPPDDLVGRVQWVLPYAGYLLTLLSLPLGVLFVVGTGISLFACAWLLETLELRGSGRGRRLLHKTPVQRVRVATGMPAAGRPLWASVTGTSVANRLARGRAAGAVATRPSPDGWRAVGGGSRTRRR
jgi:signal peptidase